MTSSAPAVRPLIPFVAVAIIALALGLSLRSVLAPPPVAATAEPTPAPPVSPTAKAPPESAAARIERMAEAEQRAALAAEDLRQTIESRFVSDTLDAQWSVPAETAMVAAAAEPALLAIDTPLSLDARCTGHLCRVEMTFDDASSAADWASFYPVSLAPTVTRVHTVVENGPDGLSRLRIYGSRAGSESLLSPPPGTPPSTAAAPRG